MQHLHLLSLEPFDAVVGVNSFEAFVQILAGAMRPFASFDPAHFIEFCRAVHCYDDNQHSK
jgi:hypothetical protein